MTPDTRDDEFEARFAEIVAHWDAEAGEHAADEGLAGGTPPAPEPARDLDPVTPAAPPPPRPDPVDQGWRAYEPPEDEPFEPPAPAPLPRLSHDPWFWVSLLGIVGGGLTLLGIAILAPDGAPRVATWAFVALIAGFVVLVVRHTSRGREQEREGWEDDSGTAL